MKQFLASLLLLVCFSAVAAPLTDEQFIKQFPDKVQVSKAFIMEITHTLQTLAQERNDALAERDYWYKQYKEIAKKDGVCT